MHAPTLTTNAKEVGKRRRLPIFDVLRAGAATIVFAFHYTSFAAPQTVDSTVADSLEWLVSRLGGLGTNLLLLLSGFFLAQSLAGGRFAYGRFVALRLIRIYVPYIVVVGMAVGFAHVSPQHRSDVYSATWTTILSQFLLLPGLFPERPILTVTWTLSYIVAGYLLFPIVSQLFKRLRLDQRGRIRGWAIVTGLVFVGGLAPGLWSIRLSYIPAGCLVFELQTAINQRERRVQEIRKALAVLAVSITLRVLLDGKILGADWSPVLFRSVYTASGLIVTTALIDLAMILQQHFPWSEQNPVVRFVAGYGRTGYSFYLMHSPAVKLFALILFPLLAAQGAPGVVYWLVMPVCWGVAAVAALLLYRLVELPSRRILMQKVAGLDNAR